MTPVRLSREPPRPKGAWSVDDMPEGELKVGHIKGHERTDLLVSLDEFLITND